VSKRKQNISDRKKMQRDETAGSIVSHLSNGIATKMGKGKTY